MKSKLRPFNLSTVKSEALGERFCDADFCEIKFKWKIKPIRIILQWFLYRININKSLIHEIIFYTHKAYTLYAFIKHIKLIKLKNIEKNNPLKYWRKERTNVRA